MRYFSLLTLSLLLAACGPVVTHPADETDASDHNAIVTPGLPPIAKHSAHYRIGAGDELAIKFYFAPELSDTVQVRPDGKISLMFAGDVQAAGLTPEQLAKSIRRHVRKYVKQSELVVIVRNAASQKVFVSGEVAKPGAVQLQGRETLLQVLSEAGGISSTGRSDEVALIRSDAHGQQHVYALDVSQIISGENTAQNVVMQAGDIVMVPPSDVSSFDRWIDQHIRLVTPIPSSFVITNQYKNGTY